MALFLSQRPGVPLAACLGLLIATQTGVDAFLPFLHLLNTAVPST